VRRSNVLLLVIVAGAAAAAAQWLPDSLTSGDQANQTATDAGKHDSRVENPPDKRWTALPERETIGRPAGELFFPHSWAPPPPPPQASAGASAPKPAPPPMPYRVAGKMLHEGPPEIVLAKGDAVLPVRVGDTLDDGYRVVSIRPDEVTLLYVPLGVRHTLRLGSTFIIDEKFASAPAQLRWSGPKEVKAGDPFTVALKVSSGQPVRAVPLKLTYDAAILEPVDVRPGGFFPDAMFTYRINPEGSISVGASGKETTASDADLLVVTFKAIRPGTTAELKLSSMQLQSAAGVPIAHDQLAAFRTAIIR
jgi:hypothetical protein